jgi:hypothetical protein
MDHVAGPVLLATRIHEVLALLEREQFPIPNHPRSAEISGALMSLRSLALAHAAPPPSAARLKVLQPPDLQAVQPPPPVQQDSQYLTTPDGQPLAPPPPQQTQQQQVQQ